MLKSLYVKHYALIDELSVEFGSGLNIITGETGAGKSILIDALSLLLGERATTEMIRKGEEKAIVEGVVGIAGQTSVRSLLAAHDIEAADELILRREVSKKGQSRCFINDSPVPVGVLKEVGDMLVDLHGQHEHQSLLRTETHIDFLDDFGGLDGLVKEYREAYDTLRRLIDQREELSQREQQLKERRDLYEFQMKEIDAVAPHAGEEALLESELKVLENAEALFEATTQLYQILYEGDGQSAETVVGGSVYDQLVLVRNRLADLAEIDPSFEEVKNESASAVAVVAEITKFIQSYNSKIEFNPERLEEIRERLGQLSLLKKKYGGSVEAVLQHREKIGKEFALAENFEKEIRILSERVEEARGRCSEVAQRLSAKRQELVPRITKSVVAELTKLGIANARFDVVINNNPVGKENGEQARRAPSVRFGREFYETTPKGIDHVEFFLSTNVGEDPKPLTKVASGGEISRVMLALKTILAKSERLPLLIFDEIDVGVSGRIAQAVGKSLKALSQFHQVIAITHLPQIAGLADQHFVVEKVEEKKRTTTRMRRLTDEERVEEVAKLMSGAEVTAAGLRSARELMGLK